MLFGLYQGTLDLRLHSCGRAKGFAVFQNIPNKIRGVFTRVYNNTDNPFLTFPKLLHCIGFTVLPSWPVRQQVRPIPPQSQISNPAIPRSTSAYFWGTLYNKRLQSDPRQNAMVWFIKLLQSKHPEPKPFPA